MILRSMRAVLEPISSELARRIIAREERAEDAWHPEYPLVDELDPLRSLAESPVADPDFGMYMIRRISDGLAVGGFGFFGAPDAKGRVEFGYGLVPSGRGEGLATEAVTIAIEHAQRHGAEIAAADAALDNVAPQRVLAKCGFTEVARDDSFIFYQRELKVR